MVRWQHVRQDPHLPSSDSIARDSDIDLKATGCSQSLCGFGLFSEDRGIGVGGLIIPVGGSLKDCQLLLVSEGECTR